MNPMKLEFHENIIIYDSQPEHIWSNTPLKQCISRTTQVFYTNHNPIRFAFKLCNHITQFQQIKQFFTIQPPKEDKAVMQYTTCFVLECGGCWDFCCSHNIPIKFSLCSPTCSQQFLTLSHILCPKFSSCNLYNQPPRKRIIQHVYFGLFFGLYKAH